MGAGAADIAEIVPEVRQRFPDLGPAARSEDPRASRFRLFDSITTFFKNAARSRPLVLVIDNLHWADQPSLQLCEFVAREVLDARILVLGTCRDTELSPGHPLLDTLGELAHEPFSQQIHLSGLPWDDVSGFFRAAIGMDPPTDFVDTVFGRTEGNPLFVIEIMRLLMREGMLPTERDARGPDWDIPIPETVRMTISRRLERLSEGCRQTLTVAYEWGV
jgi:predicted ATPase